MQLRRSKFFDQPWVMLALMAYAGCAPVSIADKLDPPASVTGASMLLPQIDISSAPRNRIFISAIDQSSNPLTLFKMGNFSITEDGVPGVPEDYGLVTDPLFVCLVLDRSGSMADNGKLQAVNTAAVAMMNALKPGDSAALIEFSDTLNTTVPFTTDLSQMITAINAGTPSGSTALFDAVKGGVDYIATGPGRELLIVLTDGQDNDSHVTIDDAVKEAQIKGVGVYTVGIGPDVSVPVLSQIATQTGATNTNTLTGSDLSTIFLNILTRFNNLVFVKYRQRKNGDLKVYLNYGPITAYASRVIQQASN